MWLKNRGPLNAVLAFVPHKYLNTSTIAPYTDAHANLPSNHVYGQPVHLTHPHMIKQDELVPGIRLEEFQQRRTRLMMNIQKYAADHLQQPDKQHLVIIPSSTKKYMSDKIPYVFRQNSDFYYLSGCLEPDSALMIRTNERNQITTTMFVRPKDKHVELWEGPRTGIDLATEFFGVSEAYDVCQFKEVLTKIVQLENPVMWYDKNNSDLTNINEDMARIMPHCRGHKNLLTPTAVVQEMRILKSVAEQNLMRRTCQIASEAINDVMRSTRVGHSEHHVFAMIDYQCRIRNASHLAYPPVVASGINATIIHYIDNSQIINRNELVLMDAGCEYGGYTSDITRTWPVSGQFTEPQKVLYELILNVQKELIGTLLREGGQTLDELFETMCVKLAKYLQEIGLVPKHFTDIVTLTRAGYDFCPHHVSHYLGMDVHDTPLMPRSLKLMPGMVCTVEPGIYIPKDRNDVPKEFRGLGVRVEDDILINSNNQVEVLSAACLKERSELENLQAQEKNP